MTPFSLEFVTLTKQNHLELEQRANYYEAQHARLKLKYHDLEQASILKDAKIKNLQNRLFGKKSEKTSTCKRGKNSKTPKSSKNRGQQLGSKGHGRTKHPNLPIIPSEIDLVEGDKIRQTCSLPFVRNSPLDEQSADAIHRFRTKLGLMLERSLPIFRQHSAYHNILR